MEREMIQTQEQELMILQEMEVQAPLKKLKNVIGEQLIRTMDL